MNDFNYTYPVKVYFGKGKMKEALENELCHVGKTIMLAYGFGSIKKNGIYNEVVSELKALGKEIVEFSGIMPNPTYAKVLEGACLAKEKHVDFILAVGGGSAIDCCKIVAAQAVSDEDIWNMEFKKHEYPDKYLPMAAIVTASGTGAEMNNGAVITNEKTNQKAGVLGAYASFAVLDPYYTLSVPKKQVISGAFDTLSHCMETYFGSPRRSTISDEIAEAVMRNTIQNIRVALKDIHNIEARSELMWDSAMAENGILKLGKVTDFQAHQIEHQLGAYTDCNHGQGLAVIHPVLYKHLYMSSLDQFARFATNVWNISNKEKSQEELALAGVHALADFIKEIGLPSSFREMGLKDKSVLKKVADSCNLTKGCCKKLSREEVLTILEECW